MEILIFAFIVVILVAMLVYAVNNLPLPTPFDKLAIALVILIGALIIAQRAGVV